MSFLDDLALGLARAAGRLGPSEQRAAYQLVPIGVQARPQYPASAVPDLQAAYMRNEIVYAAINAKVKAAVDPRLVVEARQGSKDKAKWAAVAGHPMMRLARRPNPLMSEGEFLAAWFVSADVAGRFYAEKQRNRLGQPVALWPLDPAKVAPIPDGAGGVRAYEFRDGMTKVEIPAADMLAWRAYHPSSRWQGLSPLAVAMGSVDADSAQTDFIRAFFNNGGVPSGLLKIKDRTLSEAQKDGLRAQWVARFGRRGRQHDVAVLDDAGEYQRIGSGLNELDSESLREFTETRVAMVFGVPPLVIYAFAGLRRSTYSNLGEAWKSFWDATLTPALKSWSEFLTWNLLTEFVSEDLIFGERVRLNWDMSQVAALQENLDAMQERARKNFAAGAITLNEFREAIGEDQLPDGEYFVRPRVWRSVPVDEVAVAVVAAPVATAGADGVPAPVPDALPADAGQGGTNGN